MNVKLSSPQTVLMYNASIALASSSDNSLKLSSHSTSESHSARLRCSCPPGLVVCTTGCAVRRTTGYCTTDPCAKIGKCGISVSLLGDRQSHAAERSRFHSDPMHVSLHN